MNRFGSIISMSFCAVGMFAEACWADCSAKNQDPHKPHVEFLLESLPTLQFYLSPHGANSPIIQLNDKGLYVEGNLVCEWPNNSFSKTPEPNRVLGFDGEKLSKPCPKEVPVKSGFGDMGVGTAVLCVEVEAVKNSIAEVQYKGKRLYLSLQEMPKDNWRYELPRKKKSP